MKKLIILLVVVLFLTACTNDTIQSPDAMPTGTSSATTGAATRPSEAPPEVTQIVDDGYDDYFVYPINDVIHYSVDKNGDIYTVGNNTTITVYDMNGKKTGEHELPYDGITNLCIGDGILYFTWYSGDDHGLACYDLISGEITMPDALTSLHQLPDYILKLSYLDGKLYMLNVMEMFMTDAYNVYASAHDVEIAPPGFTAIDPYIYDGRVLSVYDTETGVFEIIYDTSSGLIEDFALTPYGTIIYQAYDYEFISADDDDWTDVDDRFYFAEIYLETMSFSDRVYRNTGKMASFKTDGWGVIFVKRFHPDPDGNRDIYYWSLGDDASISILKYSPFAYGFPNSLQYRNGFIYAQIRAMGEPATTMSFTLERIRVASVIDFEPPIELISANNIGDIPRGTFNTNLKIMTPDEFSLTVLSGGASYDIAYIRSRQDFAYNIRNKGAFYPLNDVPGVREYLDDCFPYIRDAATDKNGDIWMLPISINVAAVVFDDENCRDAGLDFKGAPTAGDVISVVEKGVEYDASGTNYVFSTYEFMKQSLSKYLASNNTLDTPEFRSLAPALKDLLAKGTTLGTFMPHMDADRISPNQHFLFDNATSQTSSHLIDREGLSIIPLAGTGGLNPADVIFLCVNPASDKLDKVLEYITYICEVVKTTRTDTGLFFKAITYTDSEYAQKRRAMYENAVISFAVSDEVFAADFNRYLNNDIDLETLIKEAGRKLAMYLGE